MTWVLLVRTSALLDLCFYLCACLSLLRNKKLIEHATILLSNDLSFPYFLLQALLLPDKETSNFTFLRCQNFVSGL
jgi:hypothetical protein